MANDTNRKIPDGAYAMVTEALEKGETPAAVEQRLVALGVDPGTASKMVAEQHRAADAVAKSDGRTEMRFGAIAFGGGVIVLVVTGVGSLTGWFGMTVGAVGFIRGLSKQRASRAAGG